MQGSSRSRPGQPHCLLSVDSIVLIIPSFESIPSSLFACRLEDGAAGGTHAATRRRTDTVLKRTRNEGNAKKKKKRTERNRIAKRGDGGDWGSATPRDKN